MNFTQNLMTLPADSAEIVEYKGGESINNVEENTKWAVTPGSVYWLFLLTLVYVLWGYWQNKEGARESLSPGDLKNNLGNIVKITLAVAIGFNIMNVFLTKLAAMRIPVLSRIAGTFLPLFHL